MKLRPLALALALTVTTAVGGAAEARGCVSGALVGGVAGHFMHHHALAGAAVGCVVNHHIAHVHDQRARRRHGH